MDFLNQVEENTVPEYFQICINILEAKDLAVSGSKTFVTIKVGKIKKMTSICESRENPYYNEYFVFDLYLPIEELLRTTIAIEVLQKTCCCQKNNIVGRCTLDVATLWKEPCHGFYHKWAILTSVYGPDRPMGYLQLDLSVQAKDGALCKRSVYIIGDDINENLLLPAIAGESNKAHYKINIYNAELHLKNKRKSCSYYVRVQFAGRMGRTSLIHDTFSPVWNEVIHFFGTFPPLCQSIIIQIVAVRCCRESVISEHSIKISSISDSGANGFLPTFGPANVFFQSGPFYQGKLMLSVFTNVEIDVRGSGKKHDYINPIDESKMCEMEQIVLYTAIFECSYIDKKYAGRKLGFDLAIGEHSTNNIASYTLAQAKKRKRTFMIIDGRAVSIHFQLKLIDMRRRFFDTNMNTALIKTLKSNLKLMTNLFESKVSREEEFIKTLQKLIGNTIIHCEKWLRLDAIKIRCGRTKLDTYRSETYRRLVEDILQELHTSLQIIDQEEIVNLNNIKKMLTMMQIYLKSMENFCLNPQDSWPDVVVWLRHNKHLLGYHKVAPLHIIYSDFVEQRGSQCGKQQTIFFKPKKCENSCAECDCVVGKAVVMFWLGLWNQRDKCIDVIPTEWMASSTRDDTSFAIPEELHCSVVNKYQYRIYIHQGRIKPGHDPSGLCDPGLRFTVKGLQKDTKILKETLNPLWDEVIVFESVAIYGEPQNVKQNPSLVVVEIYDTDAHGKIEFFGRTAIKPLVKILTESYDIPPKLTWQSLSKIGEVTAEVLIAIELLQLSNDSENHKQLEPSPSHLQIPEEIRPRMMNFRGKVMFWGLRDLKRLHMFNISRPSVHLDLGSNSVDSGLCSNYDGHCVNFLDPYKVFDITLPVQSDYWPALTLKLLDRKSFGRVTVVGAFLEKNAARFQRIREPEEEIVKYVQIKDSSSTVIEENSISPSMKSLPRKEHQEGDIISNFNICGVSCKIVKRNSPNTEESETQRSEPPSSVKGPDLEKNEATNKPKVSFIKIFGRKIKFISKKAKNVKNKNETVVEEKSKVDKEIEDNEIVKKEIIEEEFDWWTKFYNSLMENLDVPDDELKQSEGHCKLQIYESELEKQREFSGFKDWCDSFVFTKGANDSRDVSVGLLKAKIELETLESDEEMRKKNHKIDQHPLVNDPIRLCVRVYVIRGLSLHPKDNSGTSDPYIIVSLGNGTTPETRINDRANYVSKKIDPVFGRMYELQARFPRDHILKVDVMDMDVTSHDDLIGSTTIDIEDRFYSDHRAACGLPEVYSSSGYNMWRDSAPPSILLKTMCAQHNMEASMNTDNAITVGGFMIQMEDSNKFLDKDADETTKREQLSLQVLRNWQLFSPNKITLVPEHVETRILYNPTKPGLEQGKLQLWVDLFPVSYTYPPPAVNISPRSSVEYELRVIVWNTKDVLLGEDEFYTGEKMADIYVRAWVNNPKQAQTTDIHYRSITGEGNFNWRLIFRFKYLYSEGMVVESIRDSVFGIGEIERKTPCKLNVQIWDNDSFSEDDLIGSLVLDLRRLCRGARSSEECTMETIKPSAPRVNLFKLKSIRGWWPCKARQKDGTYNVTGKVELELQIMTNTDAATTPAGEGHKEPQALPEPHRPDTSFKWFKNPFKVLTIVLWRKNKKKCILFTIGLLLVVFVLLAVYALPGLMVQSFLNKLFNAL